MNFYAITYDLRQPGRNYSSLYDAIKELAGAGNWQHPMESFWVIAVSENSFSAADIYDKLREHTDDNDSIIVLQMSGDYKGWMPMTLWNWIKEKRDL